MRGNLPARRRPRASRSGSPQPAPCRRSWCGTMESDSTWITPKGYSCHSGDCTESGSFRGPESGSRPRSASWLDTAVGSGPKVESEKVRHSSSRCLRNYNIHRNGVVPPSAIMDRGNRPGEVSSGEAPPRGTSSLRLDRFQRTGEMGRRIAEFDWTTTSLGAIESWPRSFQSTIATLLGSRYPMILVWGEELLQFYNDAYIGVIGNKHPEALGITVRETMAESWDTIGPMIAEVMATGIPNWVPANCLPLVRSGYLEESYFSLSCSAVDDDDGEIRGMLCVCSEVTEQVVNARRGD